MQSKEETNRKKLDKRKQKRKTEKKKKDSIERKKKQLSSLNVSDNVKKY